jgi:hypothetical protein
LRLAGVRVPRGFHGQPLFGGGAKPRQYVVTARDRCDMTRDRIRAVRDSRWKYIRNFMPERPYTQHNDYIEKQYPTLGVLKQLHAAGKLNAVQSLFMAERKPEVEFYDTQADPHEVHNLAGDARHGRRVAEFAARLDRWIRETGDQGGRPESEEAQLL